MSLLCKHIPGTQTGAADTFSSDDLPLFQRLVQGASAAVRRPATVPGAGDPRLDKGSLDILVWSYFVKGLAQSTDTGCMLVASGDTSLSAPQQGCWGGRTSCVGLSPRWPARA